MDKKKLDELFQKKFLDFKEMPDEKVWSSIEASLDKKKKNRIIPLWWQLGGIAAALLIGFVLFNPFSTSNTTEEIITNVEQTDKKIDSTEVKTSKEFLPQEGIQDVDVAVEDEKTSVIKEKNHEVVNASDKTVEQKRAEPNQFKENAQIVNKDWSSKEERLAKTNNDLKDGEQKTVSAKDAIDETAIAITDARPKQNDTEKSVTDTYKTAPVAKEVIENPESRETGIAELDNQKQEAIEGAKNKDIGIAEIDNEEKAVEDSKEKSIFKEIEEEEEEMVAEKSDKKWSAGPSIAPVYFNAIGEGSPVHSIFTPNSKSGNVNLSYGLSVAYEVSRKLKIRSGIHRVDYGYNTNDVEFSSSLTSSTNGQISSINYAATSKNLVVNSKTSSNSNLEAVNNSIDVLAQNPARDGVMSQQLGYLEVPLELNYTLVDNKFGVNIIGGVSSLFLMDNAVALTSGDLTTEMGEANNVNSMNFSTNIGLGVNYKFSPQIQLNIEPLFKYQLNTFSETAGDFRPYSIGIYSGLSFKF